jgi:TolB protein
MGTERRITSDAAVVWSSSPAKISGDHIVWYDDREGGQHLAIYLYDLASQTERLIGGNPYVWDEPAINGNRIVWSEERNRNMDVYSYDVTSACVPPSAR